MLPARIALGLMIVLTVETHAQEPNAQPPRQRFAQQYYPMPSYLPPGFVLVGVHNDPPDGFHGGLTELRFLYQNTTVPVRQRFFQPLMIFMTPTPQVRFGTTRDHAGKNVTLTTTSGDTVAAEYHDGMWVMDPDGERVISDSVHTHWSTETVHSLIFKWRDLTVGIRGSRASGVSYDELIHVASSMNGNWPPPPPGMRRQ